MASSKGRLAGAAALFGTLLALSAPARAGWTAPERDCNGNGVEDAVDIAVGTSGDANWNGVPDECEVQPERCPAPGAALPGDPRDARHPSAAGRPVGGKRPAEDRAGVGSPGAGALAAPRSPRAAPAAAVGGPAAPVEPDRPYAAVGPPGRRVEPGSGPGRPS